jgi:hypothetical protein
VSGERSQDELTTEDTFVFLQRKVSGYISGLSINMSTLGFWDFVLEYRNRLFSRPCWAKSCRSSSVFNCVFDSKNALTIVKPVEPITDRQASETLCWACQK